MQFDIQDRRKVYSILEGVGIEIPRYAVLDRDSPDPKRTYHNICSINDRKHIFFFFIPIAEHELVESEDHVEVNGITFNKPFVEVILTLFWIIAAFLIE